MSKKTLRYLGFAEEATFNQVTPPAAAYHLDIASASLDNPADTELVYSGGLSRGQRTKRPGFYAPTGNLAYAFDIKTIGWLLKWTLGSYGYTAGATVEDLNTHEIYPTNEVLLPSFTSRLGKDVFEHVFSGCSVNTLEIAVEGEFATATVDIVAAKDTKDTIKEVDTLLLSDAYPLAFHDVTVSLNNGDLSASVKSLTLGIANNLSSESGRGVGSRYPNRLVAGERQVTFAMTLWYENTAQLERFWGGATGPTDAGATEFPLQLVFDAGTDGQMTIAIPRAYFTQVDQQPSGRDEIDQTVGGNIMVGTVTLANATEVEAELLVTLENFVDEMVVV